MNKYFKDLLRTTSLHAIAITFLVGTFTVFALTFPSSTPTGETAGGLFMSYFTKMLVNTNITTTDGTVKKADTTDGYHLNQAVTSGASPQWGTTYANNWFRSQGATGWYSETYGGGWFMQDTTRIRAYNNKNIYTAGSVRADNNIETPKVCLNGTCRTSWPSTTGDGVGPANRSCYDTTNGNDGMAQCAAGFVVVGVQANGVACGGECVATTVRCCK